MSCSSSFVVDVAFASTVAFELARSALFGMLVAEIVVVVFVAAIAVEAEVVVMLYSVTDLPDNLPLVLVECCCWLVVVDLLDLVASGMQIPEENLQCCD